MAGTPLQVKPRVKVVAPERVGPGATQLPVRATQLLVGGLDSPSTRSQDRRPGVETVLRGVETVLRGVETVLRGVETVLRRVETVLRRVETVLRRVETGSVELSAGFGGVECRDQPPPFAGHLAGSVVLLGVGTC
jgi:hypothetical protein